jgi:hypothetical protein
LFAAAGHHPTTSTSQILVDDDSITHAAGRKFDGIGPGNGNFTGANSTKR